MELLSPGTTMVTLADAPPLTPLLNGSPFESLLHPTPTFLALLLCGQAVSLLGTWIASKTVVEPDCATFQNALKVWLVGLAANVAALVGEGFGIRMVEASGELWRIALILCGGAMLMLLLAFLIPMKIYAIGFGRALAIVLLVVLMQLFVSTGLQLTVLKGAVPGNQVAWMKTFAGKVWGELDPDAKMQADRAASNEIDQLLNTALHPAGVPPSLAEHEAMVQALQQKLQARRDALPVNNAHELAVYQNQLNRYLYFREMVLAERHFKPAPVQTVRLGAPPASTPAH